MCAGSRRALAATAALTLCLGAVPVRAEEAPSEIALLEVLAEPTLLPQLRRMSPALRGALRAEATLIEGETLRQRREESPTLDQELEQLRLEARQHLLTFDFARAQEVLERGRRMLLEADADLLGDPRLGSFNLQLARIALDLDQRQQALETLYEVALWTPEMTPGADSYPSRLIEQWEALQAGQVPAEGLELPTSPPARLGQVAGDLDVDHAIAAHLVAGDDGAVVLRLALVTAGDGEVVNSGRVILGAAEQQWSETLSIAVERLLEPLSPPAPRPPRGRILLLTEPEGAVVEVDGSRREQLTPMSIEVEPGRHFLSISLDGYRRLDVPITVWEDQTSPLELELEAIEEPRNMRRLWWVWALASVVVAGVAAGLIAWGVEESQTLPGLSVNVVHELSSDPGSGRR